MNYFSAVIAREINKTSPRPAQSFGLSKYEPQDIARVEMLLGLNRTYENLRGIVKVAGDEYRAATVLDHNVKHYKNSYQRALDNYHGFIDTLAVEPYNIDVDSIDRMYSREAN
jgi:hypothetical protein